MARQDIPISTDPRQYASANPHIQYLYRFTQKRFFLLSLASSMIYTPMAHPMVEAGMQNLPTTDPNSRWLHPALLSTVGTLGFTVAFLGIYFLLFGPDIIENPTRFAIVIALPILTIALLLYVSGKQARALRSLKREYEDAIARDRLTSCLNSTLFSAMVDAHPTLTGSRTGRRRGSFLVVDIDQLGVLNRTAGQRAGDRVLRIVGEIIRGSVRSDDLVGRLGGGRFGIFLPGATSENSEKVAERIRNAVSEAHFRHGGRERPLSVSVGAAAFDQEIDYDNLVQGAERILERAKQNGRNRVEYGHLESDSSPSRPSLH